MRTQVLSAHSAGIASILANVASYQHPELIERLKRKLNLSSAGAGLLFEDVKKYLVLVVTTGEKLAPTPAVDAGWHEFLMYTRDYANFCDRFFGAFVHHAPTPILKPRIVHNLDHTVALAFAAFGTLSENWTDSPGTCSTDCEPECAPDHDCHGDGSCGGDV